MVAMTTRLVRSLYILSYMFFLPAHGALSSAAPKRRGALHRCIAGVCTGGHVFIKTDYFQFV